MQHTPFRSPRHASGARPTERPEMSEDQKFPGFDEPKSNYSKLPHAFIGALPIFKTLGELKVVLYILRHTWGYAEYGRLKKFTLEEFMHGRKRKNGGRIDDGVGMSKPSIVAGLKLAVEHGFLVAEVDERDLGRVKKFYTLAMFLPEAGDEGVTEFYSSDPETLHRTEIETPERKEKTPADSTPDAPRYAVGQRVAYTPNGDIGEVIAVQGQNGRGEWMYECLFEVTSHHGIVPEPALRPAPADPPAPDARPAVKNRTCTRCGRFIAVGEITVPDGDGEMCDECVYRDDPPPPAPDPVPGGGPPEGGGGGAAAGGRKEEPPAKAKGRKPRASDPLFEAVCECTNGVPYAESTKGQQSYARAVMREINGHPDLKGKPPTVQEVLTFRKRFADATNGLTFPDNPRKIAKWLAELRLVNTQDSAATYANGMTREEAREGAARVAAALANEDRTARAAFEAALTGSAA